LPGRKRVLSLHPLRETGKFIECVERASMASESIRSPRRKSPSKIFSNYFQKTFAGCKKSAKFAPA